MNAPQRLPRPPATPKAPLIPAGQGLRIDDRFAHRLARKLVALVTKEEADIFAAVRGYHSRGNSSGLGSVKAQNRLFARVKKLLQYAILAGRIDTGNRGRFVMSLARLGSLPEIGRGVYVVRETYRGSPDGNTESAGDVLLEISLHTLQRLIQRAEVTSLDGATQMLRDNWPIIELCTVAIPRANRGAWPVPIMTPKGLGYFVVERHAVVKRTAVTFVRIRPHATVRQALLAKLYADTRALFDAIGESLSQEEGKAGTVKLYDAAAIALGLREIGNITTEDN